MQLPQAKPSTKAEPSEEEAIALGFPNSTAAQQHADWLAQCGSPEYLAWLASIPPTP